MLRGHVTDSITNVFPHKRKKYGGVAGLESSSPVLASGSGLAGNGDRGLRYRLAVSGAASSFPLGSGRRDMTLSGFPAVR